MQSIFKGVIRVVIMEFKLNKEDLKDSSSVIVDFDSNNQVGVAFTISENGGISAVCSGSYEPEVNTTK